MLRKATEQEKADYWGPGPSHPVYKLYGWVTMRTEDGQKITCPVEDLRGAWSKEEPQYEIMMPDGYTAEDCHSLLCYNLQDLRGRATITLEKCLCCFSDCNLHWAINDGGPVYLE